MDAPVEAGPVVAPRQQRDRVIPLRKSDIIDGLVAEGRLDEADQEKITQLARMLGAILHYQYSAELDHLRETYFLLRSRGRPARVRLGQGSERGLPAIERRIRPRIDRCQLRRGLASATTKAFAERARVRVKIKAPIEDYRDVRMFRRGSHMKTIEIPARSAYASVHSRSRSTTTSC